MRCYVIFKDIMKNVVPGTKYINLDEEDRFVFAIGDVHGCAEEFETLCGIITRLYKDPIIVQLGDLIDRGPYFKEVFDVVEKYNVITLIGNHELNFLLEHRGFKRCNSQARRESHDRFDLLSAEEQERIIEIMDRSYNAVIVKYRGNNAFLSHSPLKNLEALTHNYSAWSCCTRNDPYDNNVLSCYQFIGIHGHQHWNYRHIEDQIADKSNSFNVDGGAVYGGELVALEVARQITIKVSANKTYFNR